MELCHALALHLVESSDACLFVFDWEFDVHALILDTFNLSGEFGSFF